VLISSKCDYLNYLRLLRWLSIIVVEGTPEKPSLSKRYAATSLMQASPESTPALKDCYPKRPTWSLGLLGAKASSSIGLKTASGFFEIPRIR
jgi:hypothetical protein